MTKNDIILVTPMTGHQNPSPAIDGPTMLLFQRAYKGTEDLAYHGSPLYEDFIECVDPKTGKALRFGSQSYHWEDPVAAIRSLKEKLNRICSIAQF